MARDSEQRETRIMVPSLRGESPQDDPGNAPARRETGRQVPFVGLCEQQHETAVVLWQRSYLVSNAA
jgi:hypothetical protein